MPSTDSAHQTQSTAIVPQPVSQQARSGTFTLNSSTVIVTSSPHTDALAWLLHDYLRKGTGHALAVQKDAPVDNAIVLRLNDAVDDSYLNSAESKDSATEAYRVTVAPHQVELSASHLSGLARAIATFRQLLPAHTLRNAPARTGDVTIGCVEIDDEPRLRWRGLMLDVVRHFQPKEFVLRMIDLAWLHRLNVLQFHLTDDQGWRFDVPNRPKLKELATWRPETVRSHAITPEGYDGTPHGGIFSHDDLREIVAYAKQRHITVVPEVNLPGHSRAVLAAYPELGAGQNLPVATTFGIFEEVLEPINEVTEFFRDVFDTIVDIFESPYVHIGGDEIPTAQWESSPKAAALMEAEGIESARYVQTWFTKQLTQILRERGKAAIGWDEILAGGAPPEAVVTVWRNSEYVTKAAQSGHQVIVGTEQFLYLDHYESDGPDEPLRIHGHTPLEKIYDYDPMPGDCDPDLILGAQCQVWTEYLPSSRDIEYTVFPRLCAVADATWSSPQARKEFPIADRVPSHLDRLDALGVNYRPLNGPHPWQKGGTGIKGRRTVNYQAHGADDL